jgi:hypothetical protein
MWVGVTAPAPCCGAQVNESMNFPFRDSGTIRLMALIAVFWLLISALRACTVTHKDTDRYALPITKTYLEPCARASLTLHPRIIQGQRILHRNGVLLVRYVIASNEGAEWIILCDGSTGKIVGEQRLLD